VDDYISVATAGTAHGHLDALLLRPQ
jgi:hypothetical protein